MDFGGSGRRLNAKQLVDPGALVAIAEPGFDGAVDDERNRDSHEQREQVFLEKAAKAFLGNHASGACSIRIVQGRTIAPASQAQRRSLSHIPKHAALFQGFEPFAEPLRKAP
ncbi:hypothetical protein [Bradyrhizobium lablabi]|uniref:hypothetical protein n=1 Tax=Bradyrhizobium lablabi TaxID=722472 RepID=UPI0032DEF983